MPRLPQVSGRSLIRLPVSLGYEAMRQKGSHIRFCASETHLANTNLSVPDHDTLAKGTLNDTQTRASLWNSIPKEQLIER
jgi:predicted RNA binding protein YcfA (HicA-like mRNA interferase family)